MPAKKSGLGKGLDSLIPNTKGTAKTEGPVNKDALKGAVMMDINKIEPNKDQPRKKFNEDDLQDLCDSIKLHGILDPLLVQKRDGYYEIIGGERRWRASKKLGLEKVPVIVMELSDQEFAEVSLIENIQRKDLDPIEEALAYQRLITEFNMKQDEVADRVSKSRTAITNSIRLLKLCDKVQQMIVNEMLTAGQAKPLIGIDEDTQIVIAERIYDEKLSTREIEKLVKDLKSDKKKPDGEKKKIDQQMVAIYHDLEEQMKEILGTKVAINFKDEKTGKLEIEYFSQDELDRIIDLIRTVRK